MTCLASVCLRCPLPVAVLVASSPRLVASLTDGIAIEGTGAISGAAARAGALVRVRVRVLVRTTLHSTNATTNGNWLNFTGTYDVIHFNFGLHDLVDAGDYYKQILIVPSKNAGTACPSFLNLLVRGHTVCAGRATLHCALAKRTG